MRGSKQYTGKMEEEEIQALNRASLSNTLRSFLNHTIETPPSLFFPPNGGGDEYLSNVWSAMRSISAGLSPGIR